jgi:glycosyltransferase involved in cell wall biosynthesis
MSRALVVTIVHHPEDARIRHREIEALLSSGWQVTYAAPFSGFGVAMPTAPRALIHVDLPRSTGRRRFRALRAAREVLASQSNDHDVVLVHDPELLLTLPGLDLPPVVWDVHEDTAASLTLKPWLPPYLRQPVAALVSMVERFAARRVYLILAEESYSNRFGSGPLVVPNTVRVPDTVKLSGDDRVVYLGHVTLARGAAELVDIARRLAESTRGAIRMLVVGGADDQARRLIETAAAAGYLDWPGFVPSDQALGMLSGALAGLSLLHDEPNYRNSVPTKIIEYMAYGVPVITTPLPLAADLVRRAGAGVVIPFRDPAAAVAEVLRLRADATLRAQMGAAGHRVATAEFDWRQVSIRFVEEIDRIASQGNQSTSTGRRGVAA